MKESEIVEKTKQICTKDFLEKLTEVSRMYGWTRDYYEISGFVEDLHFEAGFDVPNLDPYEIDYEK